MYCGCTGIVFKVVGSVGFVPASAVVAGLPLLGVSEALAGVTLLSVLAVLGADVDGVVPGAIGGSIVLGVTVVVVGIEAIGVLCLPMPRFCKKLRIGPACTGTAIAIRPKAQRGNRT